MFATTDGGLSWSAANTGLANVYVNALAIDPASHPTVFATVLLDGVYRSLDGGATWSSYSAGLGSVATVPIAIAPTTPTQVYTGTFGQGIFMAQ